MAEVINLRLARKAKARADKTAQAASNRAAFGESKATKAARKAEVERTARHIDGHQREPD
jgi:Domain of unknown function (DUF4169)